MKSKVKITTKKLIAVLLTLLIISSVLPSFTVTTSAAGITATTPKKDGNGVYQIGTAAELYGFAQLVNSGNTGASAVLTADIVVNTGVLKADGTLNSGTFTDWTPIGNSYSNQYTGTFDGQGHTISGLYFNNSSTNHVGLFGCLGSGGEIKNVGVIDSYFKGYYYVSGVCGYNNGGTITGCYNTSTVSSYYYYVGGVCGVNDGGTITGCYNTGTVSGKTYVGGVCGLNQISGTITGCYNTGTVSGKTYVGGVCGLNYGTITGCYTNRSGDTYYKPDAEFKDNTVCKLLNTALKNANSDVRFYQGTNYPEVVRTPQLVDGMYQISSVPELYWFADKVNNDNANYGSAKAVLTADIVVNENVLNSKGELNSGTFTDWTPIGNKSNPYTGTFDGQGHTISGLYFNNANTSYVGLFGYLSSGGEIKNVGVIGSYFSGDWYVGGVCGENQGTITGCYNTGTVTGSYYIGGVCGDNYKGTITDCYNTGKVSSTYNYVGGVCGENNFGTITSCYNTGTVSGKGNVGGVCGHNYGTMTGCYNTGTVIGKVTHVGGVCGWNRVAITGCYNTGTVIGDSATGGVCGYNDNKATITGCYTNRSGDTYYKPDAEFKDGTVCGLLNTALKNENANVRFYQGTNYPELISNVPKLVDSVYQISSAAELYGFAQLVNKLEPSANAVLTADIVVNTDVLKADRTLNTANSGNFDVWTPIGNSSNKYTGTFDGQGHTISGLYFNNTSTSYVGLFSCLGTDGEIKNVGVINSYFRGYSYVGGICGENNSGTITGCYNTGTVSSSYNYAGGVCGVNRNTITGCYNTGSVNGRSRVGGVCGWNGTNGTTTSGTMTGCYNIGAVSSSNGSVGGVCGYNYTTITGCYTNNKGICGYNDGGTISSDCAVKSDTEFTDTTVCGQLNAALKNYGSDVRFYQGVKLPEFIHTPRLVDGVYQIGLVAELYWFAGLVNGTLTDGTEQNTSAKAVLTADIIVNKNVLNSKGELNSGTFTDWTPIGYYKSLFMKVAYSGTFDGQGHTISGLYFNNTSTSSVGLFGYLDSGGEIKNVGVIDSYFNGNGYVGGVCGYNYGGTITASYNTGTVSGSYVGGVCGYNNFGTITGCYNIGTVNGGGDYVGGVCGYNSSYSTITGCYTNNKDICGFNNGTISSDCAVKSDTEFKDTTVCKLLNTALKNANSDVRYYQGEKYPEFLSNVPDIVDGVYQISNKLELYAFAQLVNSGSTGANAVLTADIVVNTGVLNDKGELNRGTFDVWTPIGNNSNRYTGTFDGQGHAISGLYFNNLSTSYVGLFGYLGSGGEIKNVGVIDSYFKGYLSIGGVCGYNKGTITDSYSTGTVSGTKSNVGGVCGQNNGEISGCYNTGTVSDSGSSVGGVCGQNSGEISGCYNTGTVSDSGSSVGGICGENNSGEITGCYNTGTVSGSDGSFYVGGVCGLNYSGTITGSYNTGTVNGTDYVGGVCGNNYKGTITGCYTNRSGDTYYYKSDEEFKNGTVCRLLNTALKNASSKVLFCQRIGTDDSPLFDHQIEEHTAAIYTVENNAFRFVCLCGKETKKTMELTLTTQKTVVASGAANTLTAKLSNYENEVVTYKWYQNGVEIEGASSSTYNMPTNLSAGTYKYRVDVTMDGVGTISSQSVDVVVDIASQYYVEIPATNVNIGGSFTVSASNVLLKNNAQLKVSLESDFVLSNEKGTPLKYEILTNNGKINSGDTLLTVVGSDNPTAPGSGTSETYNVALAQGEKPKHSGNYTDTLTFKIKVEQ